MRRRTFDAAFLDIDLHGASGLQIAAALRQKPFPSRL
jgi:DNA-binding LytR/AlgR family response regulator